MTLKKVSPNTISGSFSNDLIIRKLWAIEELSKISANFQTVYVLGSWYGNMGFVMSKTNSIDYDRLFNVDRDQEVLDASEKLYKKAEIDNARFLKMDANRLKYQNAKDSNLVINTSTNNIKGNQWFKHIPKGSIVLLQGRNNDPGAVNKFESLKDFKSHYPLKRILYAGSIDLTAANADYESFMIIGIK